MITPELIEEIRAALEIIGNWKIGPPGGITGFGKHFRYIYSDGISIRISGDNSNVVAESVLTLRNNAPALLDEIERLREENARLDRCFDRQQEIANDAQTELARANKRVAQLEGDGSDTRIAGV